jgi:CDP-diacylglycerol--glycerol-3-phosphate 3-phosphatidyltransferase
VLYGYGHFFYAGLVLLFANVFDILDGAVARKLERVTRFGAFFDSVIDRYSDITVFVGITTYYARQQSTLYVVLSGIAIVGSVLVSYTRARAESLIPKCKVGFLERPERVVLLIIGSLTEVPWASSSFFLHRMHQVLWLMAILSHWTVLHRVYHTWREIREHNVIKIEADPIRIDDKAVRLSPRPEPGL